MSHLYFTGLLLPGDFDPTGACASIQLCTRDERVYPVTDETKDRNMESCLRQNVCIAGELQVIDGKPRIIALSVKIQNG